MISKYHFVVNPGIHFEDDVILSMFEYMSNDNRIGTMIPQIVNTDYTVQKLLKFLPSPLSLLWRKIKKLEQAYEKFISKCELRYVPKEFIYNAPILSGCFTLLKLGTIKK